MISRIQIKEDGRTPYMGIHLRPYKGEVVKFGEHILYKYHVQPARKLKERWGDAVWVGKATKSDENVALKRNGTVTARSVRGRPDGAR